MYSVGLIGNWGLAQEVLQVLLRSDQVKVPFVVTQVDDTRLSEQWFGAVCRLAKENSIEVYDQTEFRKKDEKMIALVNNHDVDLLVSCAYPYLVRDDLIRLMESKKGIVNLHGSALPKYRGVSPVVWAVINNEEEIGITLHYIDEGCDSGDIIYQGSVQNIEDYDMDTLTDKLKVEGVRIFSKYVSDLERGEESPRIPQDHSKAIPAPRIREENLLIDFHQPATSIISLVRAIKNQGPYFVINGDRINVSTARLTSERGNPSEIISVTNESELEIGTTTNSVIVQLTKALPGQPEPKQVVNA